MDGVRIGRGRAAPLARRRSGAVHWPGLRRIDFSRLSWEPDLSRDAMLLLGILVGIAQASGRFAAPVDALAYWQAGTSTNLYPESWSEVGTGYLFYPPPVAQISALLQPIGWPAFILLLTASTFAAFWYCARNWSLPLVLLGIPYFLGIGPEPAGDVPGVRIDRKPPVDPCRACDHGVAPSRALGDRASDEGHRCDRLVVAPASRRMARRCDRGDGECRAHRRLLRARPATLVRFHRFRNPKRHDGRPAIPAVPDPARCPPRYRGTRPHLGCSDEPSRGPSRWSWGGPCQPCIPPASCRSGLRHGR